MKRAELWNGLAPDGGRVRPEAQLLLAAASCAPSCAARSAAFSGVELDWSYLEAAAVGNRIAPLVHEFVVAHDLATAPEPRERFEALRAFVSAQRLRNLRVFQELIALLRAFARSGIAILPYKGPVLAQSLYRDLGERQFLDLDVVVRKDELDRAQAQLLELGYRRIDEDPERALVEDCELHFQRPDDDLVVELHWDALPESQANGFALDDVWSRLEPLELGGVGAESFGPEDLLLVLCIHGGEKHRWMRLQMLADVARLLQRHADSRGSGGAGAARALDWELLWRRAEALGREDTLLLGIFQAWVLLDAPLADELVERAARNPWILAQTGFTLGRVLREDGGLASRSEWSVYLEYAAGRAKERGHAIDFHAGRWSYAKAVLRPEWTDRQALRLPRVLGFLYYAYRPWRLLRRHGAGLLQRV